MQLASRSGFSIGLAGFETRLAGIDDKSSYTMMAVISAAGPVGLYPVFPGDRVANDYTGWAMHRKEGSWMDKKVFYTFCQYMFPIMARRRKNDRDVLLVMDACSVHMGDEDVYRLAEQYRIAILYLPSHTTSATQPLDQACIFGTVKNRLREAVKASPESRRRSATEVFQLVQRVWNDYVTVDSCKAAFRKTGIHPLNGDVVRAARVGGGAERLLTPSKEDARKASDVVRKMTSPDQPTTRGQALVTRKDAEVLLHLTRNIHMGVGDENLPPGASEPVRKRQRRELNSFAHVAGNLHRGMDIVDAAGELGRLRKLERRKTFPLLAPRADAANIHEPCAIPSSLMSVIQVTGDGRRILDEDGMPSFCTSCNDGGELVVCCVPGCVRALCTRCLKFPVPADPVDWMCWACLGDVERFKFEANHVHVAIGNKHYNVDLHCIAYSWSGLTKAMYMK